ncbi:MAG: hypothetical protein WDO17_12925 [Alphaproteobacteria bacterium]
MRPLFVVFIAALASLGAAHAQNPPLLIPAPPPPTPPPLFVPPAVPSAVTPVRTPSYGVPSNINTSTPLSSSGRVIYRQPSGASPRDRVAKRKYYKKSRRSAN